MFSFMCSQPTWCRLCFKTHSSVYYISIVKFLRQKLRWCFVILIVVMWVSSEWCWLTNACCQLNFMSKLDSLTKPWSTVLLSWVRTGYWTMMDQLIQQQSHVLLHWMCFYIDCLTEHVCDTLSSHLQCFPDCWCLSPEHRKKHLLKGGFQKPQDYFWFPVELWETS